MKKRFIFFCYSYQMILSIFCFQKKLSPSFRSFDFCKVIGAGELYLNVVKNGQCLSYKCMFGSFLIKIQRLIDFVVFDFLENLHFAVSLEEFWTFLDGGKIKNHP